MKNLRKQGTLLGILLTVAAVIPVSAKAFGLNGSETPFGGMEVAMLDEGVCDCSDTNIHYIMDYATNSEITLDYDESGKLYSNGNVDDIGGYQLGTYEPSEEECTMYAGEDCITVDTADGIYGSEPGTGTSMRKEDNIFAQIIAPIVKNLSRQNGNA